jgi:hypothetical protein
MPSSLVPDSCYALQLAAADIRVSSMLFSQGLVSRLGSSNKKTIHILKDVSGIIKPSRYITDPHNLVPL